MTWLEMDFQPCDVMFEYEKGSIISEIIDDIQRVGELDFKARWMPSHTWIVTGDQTGVEASTEGIATFWLSKYLEDPKCQIMVCRPPAITEVTVNQMLYISAIMAEKGLEYDYAGLIGDALEAFMFLDDIIPSLREVADPLHDRHALFCSALVSTVLNATTQYHGFPPMDKNTVSKIGPDMLMQQFPFEKRYFLKGGD